MATVAPVIGLRVQGPAAVPRGVVVAHAVAAAPPAQNQPACYRINHKKLHITLAGLAIGEVSNERMLATARSIGELEEFSIGDEIHTNPTDPNRPRHKHMYVKYVNPINHPDRRFCAIFDLTGWNGRILHPEIQGIGHKKKDRSNVIFYTQKDRDYIASPHLANFDAEAAETPAWAVTMNNAETVDDGMRLLQQRHPEQYYLHHERIEAGLMRRIGRTERPEFQLSDFNVPPLDLTKAVVLQGAAHMGKTQFALAHGRYPMLVSEIDDLKEIGLRTDLLVFDQMRFNERGGINMSADAIIKLLDIETSRSIGARYRNARIPKHMPRIFVTNRRVSDGEDIFPWATNRAEQEGIDSRLNVRPWISDDLRVNPAANARGAPAAAAANAGANQ